MADWRDRLAALEKADRDPIAPQYLAALLDKLAADEAALTCDSGTIATWAARHWHIRGNREFYLSGNLAPGQILWEQMVLGYPEHGVRFDDPHPDFSAWARGCGGSACTSTSPGISNPRCARR
jgi:thiamine pyrophosphate-dependent acetolactate synthase large subunit-like protein